MAPPAVAVAAESLEHERSCETLRGPSSVPVAEIAQDSFDGLEPVSQFAGGVATESAMQMHRHLRVYSHYYTGQATSNKRVSHSGGVVDVSEPERDPAQLQRMIEQVGLYA